MHKTHNLVFKQDSEPPSEDPYPSGRVFEDNVSAEGSVMELFPYLGTLGETKPRKSGTSTVRISAKSFQFLKQFFPKTTISEWNDWHWQIRNSITTLDQLKDIIRLTDDEYQAMFSKNGMLPLRITPYYLSLIDRNDPEQSLRKAVVPVSSEYLVSDGEAADPLGEDHDSPVPGTLVHRYPDRVLFLTTGFCSTYCRYCTRSRMVGDHGQVHFNVDNWEKAIDYIESHKEIRDVLLSGGDPLTLPEQYLEYLLTRIKSIPHIEIVRLGTKVPAVLPQRITTSLVRMLARFHPLWVNIHFTHPDELTPETQQACNRLADAGIPLGSQTVLLKGINDNVKTLKKLYHGLLKVRVRPYYLYQCDPILGSSHFRTTVEKGLEIIEGLRGHTTGFAVPHYVIDAPGGGGKIPLLPEYYQGRDGSDVVLRNYEGETFRYPDTSR